MSTRIQFLCDQCGALKGETNHWYAMRKLGKMLVVGTFDESDPDNDHYCGSACAIKAVSEFLGSVHSKPGETL